jgi:dynein light chain 1, axonemal
MSKAQTTCKEAIAEWSKKNPDVDISEAKKVSLICQLPSIKKMDYKLNDLVSCEHLSLSTNQIDRIMPLPGLKNLKILSLGRNNIKRIEKLDDVADTLEQLWLSYNFIEKLDGLNVLRNLRVLYVSNNNIKNWDELEKLRELPKLEELLLVGNPIYEDMKKADRRRMVIQRVPKLKKLDAVVISELDREVNIIIIIIIIIESVCLLLLSCVE